MTEETVLVGIDPQTRRCNLVGIEDDDMWAECRKHGLIPIKVAPSVARRIFGKTVPCLDALLPLDPPARAIFAHVIAPALGDGMFYHKVTESLRAIADLNDTTDGGDEVRTGIWIGDGVERRHVAIYWPVDE